MFKELKYLVKLQNIDKELLQINEIRGDLPKIVENLNNDINNLKNELDNYRNREKEIILDQDQLYLVTSNKEYDSLTSEIDAVRQEIDNAEYKIIEVNEEMENLVEAIKSKNLTLQEKLGELKVHKEQLDNTNQKTNEVQTKLLKNREEVVKLIPLRYIREYERVAKAKNGIAIVPIRQIFEEKVDKKGNIEYIPTKVSCGGCSKIVPPQKIFEIRSAKTLIRCEFCGRMLYWDNETSEVRLNNEEEIF